MRILSALSAAAATVRRPLGARLSGRARSSFQRSITVGGASLCVCFCTATRNRCGALGGTACWRAGVGSGSATNTSAEQSRRKPRRWRRAWA